MSDTPNLDQIHLMRRLHRVGLKWADTAEAHLKLMAQLPTAGKSFGRIEDKLAKSNAKMETQVAQMNAILAELPDEEREKLPL